jgi:hypothetical protein
MTKFSDIVFHAVMAAAAASLLATGCEGGGGGGEKLPRCASSCPKCRTQCRHEEPANSHVNPGYHGNHYHDDGVHVWNFSGGFVGSWATGTSSGTASYPSFKY